MNDVAIAPAPSAEVVQNKVVELLASYLKVESVEIDVDKQFMSYGLDSINAVTLIGDIEDWLDVELPTTLLWDCNCIRELALYVVDNHSELAL